MKTPIAFFIFNRPDTTAKVFAEIAKAKPSKLLVIADGPRTGREGEAENCAATRSVVDNIYWDCEVLKNYSEINMGCKRRVSSGLDWLFDTVEEAIILEDDCLPHPTFFKFCENLLSLYRHDERIMAISGDNFQFGNQRTEYSYYFSRYPHCWGWATWRRAWEHNDEEMKLWPNLQAGGWLEDILLDRQAVKYWKKIFTSAYNNRVDTWDYAWTLACWVQNGLTVLPNANLVSNIGFGSASTHTRGKSRFSEMPVESMTFPLYHPPFIIRDSLSDKFTQNIMYTQPFIGRLKQKITHLISSS